MYIICLSLCLSALLANKRVHNFVNDWRIFVFTFFVKLTWINKRYFKENLKIHTKGSHPLPFASLPSFLSSPLLFPFPFPPLPFLPSPPCTPSRRSRPQPKSICVPFSLKIWWQQFQRLSWESTAQISIPSSAHYTIWHLKMHILILMIHNLCNIIR